MEYSEIIHEFIDGTLDPAREEELFMLLGRNEDYRVDFKQQLAIKTTVKSDRLAFTPSPESTMKLFSTLGFSPQPAVVPAPVGGGAGLLRRLSGLSQGFKGALAATALCTAVFLAMLQTGNLSFNNSNNLQENTLSSNNQAKNTNSNLLANNLQTTESSNKLETPKEKIVYKYIYVKSQAPEIATVNQAIENNPVITEPKDNGTRILPAHSIVMNNYTNPFSMNSRNVGINIISPINNYSPLTLTGNNLNISLELRGSQDYYNSKANINPSEFQQFNNMIILAQYHLSDEFSLGIEYRRENFYQKYTGIKDEKLFDYEQQPNFETFGLTARYLLTPLKYSYFTPFIGGTAGFNRAGFVARGIGGIEFTPTYGYSLILGGEYSNMRFQHDNNYFNSGKFGIQFGTRIKF